MSKVDEIIMEIDGKVCYAESTGNHKAREELLEIRGVLMSYKKSKEEKDNGTV